MRHWIELRLLIGALLLGLVIALIYHSPFTNQDDSWFDDHKQKHVRITGIPCMQPGAGSVVLSPDNWEQVINDFYMQEIMSPVHPVYLLSQGPYIYRDKFHMPESLALYGIGCGNPEVWMFETMVVYDDSFIGDFRLVDITGGEGALSVVGDRVHIFRIDVDGLTKVTGGARDLTIEYSHFYGEEYPPRYHDFTDAEYLLALEPGTGGYPSEWEIYRLATLLEVYRYAYGHPKVQHALAQAIGDEFSYLLDEK